MKVVLTAISAKSVHKSLAPWCLKAYCDEHCCGVDVVVREFTVNDPFADIIDGIFEEKPDVLGLSCYVWNMELTAKVCRVVKQVLPHCLVVLGGPEVAEFSVESLEFSFADSVIKGAGERAFAELITELGEHHKTLSPTEAHRFCELPSPYTRHFFNSFAEGKMVSVRNQLVYYESARGCPFACSFCISSLDDNVQYLPVERVFRDLDLFVENGAACVKFVDRTFNADAKRAAAILRYIGDMDTRCVFHFEAGAELFNDGLLKIIEQMPSGRVQFEIGVQSVNAAVLAAVNRKTDLELSVKNIRRLVSFGNVHIHLDLIAGLPLETRDSFIGGVDLCLSLRPDMLQIGVLKMLKGTAVRRNCGQYGYSYNPHPPYNVFSNDTLPYEHMTEIRRVAEMVDKFYNKGMFRNSVEYGFELFGGYAFFNELALFCGRKKVYKTSLKNAYTLILNFLTENGDKMKARHCVKSDCQTFGVRGTLPDEL